MRASFRLGLLLALCAGSRADAFTVESIDTRFEADRYTLDACITLQAPIERVQEVLRNYEAYPQLDDRVLEARVLQRAAEHELLLYTRLRACVIFFCRRVERIERVIESEDTLEAFAIAERSDVKFGHSRITLSATAPRVTSLHYRAEMEPRFWIPRFIGRRALLSTWSDVIIELFKRVEIEANK